MWQYNVKKIRLLLTKSAKKTKLLELLDDHLLGQSAKQRLTDKKQSIKVDIDEL